MAETSNQILQEASKELRHTSSSPNLDAEVLLATVLRKDRIFLYNRPQKKLSDAQQKRYNKLIHFRSLGWPIAYLVGRKEFFGWNFLVNSYVLVPRPESEWLVERTQQIIDDKKNLINNIIDIGTGSGCIIISLAKSLKFSKINFVATDISAKALKIAKLNARQHGLGKKIKFLRGNLLNPFLQDTSCLSHRQAGKIQGDLIIANLPYLSRQEYLTRKKYLKFEPKLALTDGTTGRKLITDLLRAASEKFREAIVLMEIAPSTKLLLEKWLAKNLPHADVKFYKDYGGHWRYFEIHFS